MNCAYRPPGFHHADFKDFAAYCASRNYDRDTFTRICNIVSRFHKAGLSDSDLSALSCETLCTLLRGRPYESRADRKIATGIRRYLDYLLGYCGYSSQKPVNMSGITVVPVLTRPAKTTKERIISYIEERNGDWISAAELSKRFNVYTRSLVYLLIGCNSIEISHSTDPRDMVRYRHVSAEAA